MLCPVLETRAAPVLESWCHTTHGHVVVRPCHEGLCDLNELWNKVPVQQCMRFSMTMKIAVSLQQCSLGQTYMTCEISRAYSVHRQFTDILTGRAVPESPSLA